VAFIDVWMRVEHVGFPTKGNIYCLSCAIPSFIAMWKKWYCMYC